jgi:hypothetical protein
MDDEASAKMAELVARLKGILEELRQLEKNNDDPQLKQIAPLAALVLACIDLIENFVNKAGDGAVNQIKRSRHEYQDGSSVGRLVEKRD